MAGAPFDWAEYLRLAIDLSQNPDQASQRTSISRAYYFVYHAAVKKAIANGYPAGKHQHSALWNHYQRDINRDARRLANLGFAMKRFRENADYEANFPRIAEQMAQQLADANDFIAQLTDLPIDVPRPSS